MGKTDIVLVGAGKLTLKKIVGELYEYRDLLYFLVRRDVKARYAQSILGVGWAILRPIVSMIVFTIIFGNFANFSSDGLPYPLFSFTALVPWVYFSNALTGASESLVLSSGLLTKVYFPRVLIPAAPVVAKLLDFGIACVVLLGLVVWYERMPAFSLLPLLIPLTALMLFTALGIGMGLSALSLQYRDVRHALGYGMQVWMYASPVVYSVNEIPENIRWLYGLNPMVGIIEGFRAVLVRSSPVPWDLIALGTLSSLLLTMISFTYFRHMERQFADIV